MAQPLRLNTTAFAGCASWLDAAEDDNAAATVPEAPRPTGSCAGLGAVPRIDSLSALPDDLLIRILAAEPTTKLRTVWEAIAALACVAKRYSNVCERAGWACAAKRFGRRTNAPFGGGVHWTALAWVPRSPSQRPFDEGAFDATGAPPPADLADAFFWVEAFSGEYSDPYSCLALDAVPCDTRVVRDPDFVLDDRAVGPELVLTGFLKDAWRAWHMANVPSVRIMGALRSRVVVLYAWERPSKFFEQKRDREWPTSWDAEDWDEAVANKQCPYPAYWITAFPHNIHDISLSATYGMDVPSPHAADALFSVRVRDVRRMSRTLAHVNAQLEAANKELQAKRDDSTAAMVFVIKEYLEKLLQKGCDLTIRLKVPMPVWGHVKPWRD